MASFIVRIVVVQKGLFLVDGEVHPVRRRSALNAVYSQIESESLELMTDIGKYWARTKKNRPCEYTNDPDRHLAFQKADEDAARRADDMPQPTYRKPVKQQSPDPKMTKQTLVIKRRDSSPPVPLAKQATPEFSRKKMQPPPPASSSPFARLAEVRSFHSLCCEVADVCMQLPPWLRDAMTTLKDERPEDRFEIIPRTKTDPTAQTEYRIKCLDCPGKLYVPGPGETLQNFNIHVKNRNHRANVDTRLGRTG